MFRLALGIASALFAFGACGPSMAQAGDAAPPSASPRTPAGPPAAPPQPGPDYLVGPGDQLQIFVWDHPDLAATVEVRPDGKISTPLVEDLQAAGKKPTALARDVEKVLSAYVRSPVVTVIVQKFVGEIVQQVRVVGQAAAPKALQYRQGMTVLDVITEVGGLSEFAAGNRAKIIRTVDGKKKEIHVKLKDLIEKGKLEQNVPVLPGDVLVIPQSVL